MKRRAPAPTTPRSQGCGVFIWPLASFARGLLGLPHGDGRVPDVMIWLGADVEHIGERESGPHTVLVEVLSPSTSVTDTGVKTEEYALAGIREHWTLDSQLGRVNVFALEGRAYRLVGAYAADQRAPSQEMAGFTLDVGAVLRR
ncbi:MAG: Uma2 family endonuclease [Myxococcota bacterium]